MARVDDYISMKKYPGGMVKTIALKNAIWTDRGVMRNEFCDFTVYHVADTPSTSFLIGNTAFFVAYPSFMDSKVVGRFRRYFGEKWYSGDDKLSQSLSRSKSQLLELGLCNEWEYFVTLTLNPEWHDRYDLAAFKKSLRFFLNNYKKRVAADVRYVLVPEFHEDGAVHMHGFFSGILSAELVRNQYGYLDWPAYSKRFGYFSGGRIRDRERAAYYITKYITKDLAKLPKGSRVIMASHGLKRAEVVYKGSGGDLYDFTPDYENEWVRVKYEQVDGDFLEVPMEDVFNE